MHHSMLVFGSKENINDLDFHLAKYHFENNEYEEFEINIKKKDIKKQFDEIAKEAYRERLEEYVHLKKGNQKEHFMYEEGMTEDEDGNLGYATNPNGMMDYYTVGGRWSNVLKHKKKNKYVSESKVKDIDWTTEEDWSKVISDIFDIDNNNMLFGELDKQEIDDIIKDNQKRNRYVAIVDYHT